MGYRSNPILLRLGHVTRWPASNYTKYDYRTESLKQFQIYNYLNIVFSSSFFFRKSMFFSHLKLTKYNNNYIVNLYIYDRYFLFTKARRLDWKFDKARRKYKFWWLKKYRYTTKYVVKKKKIVKLYYIISKFIIPYLKYNVNIQKNLYNLDQNSKNYFLSKYLLKTVTKSNLLTILSNLNRLKLHDFHQFELYKKLLFSLKNYLLSILKFIKLVSILNQSDIRKISFIKNLKKDRILFLKKLIFKKLRNRKSSNLNLIRKYNNRLKGLTDRENYKSSSNSPILPLYVYSRTKINKKSKFIYLLKYSKIFRKIINFNRYSKILNNQRLNKRQLLFNLRKLPQKRKKFSIKREIKKNRFRSRFKKGFKYNLEKAVKNRFFRFYKNNTVFKNRRYSRNQYRFKRNRKNNWKYTNKYISGHNKKSRKFFKKKPVLVSKKYKKINKLKRKSFKGIKVLRSRSRLFRNLKLKKLRIRRFKKKALRFKKLKIRYRKKFNRFFFKYRFKYRLKKVLNLKKLIEKRYLIKLINLNIKYKFMGSRVKKYKNLVKIFRFYHKRAKFTYFLKSYLKRFISKKYRPKPKSRSKLRYSYKYKYRFKFKPRFKKFKKKSKIFKKKVSKFSKSRIKRRFTNKYKRAKTLKKLLFNISKKNRYIVKNSKPLFYKPPLPNRFKIRKNQSKKIKPKLSPSKFRFAKKNLYPRPRKYRLSKYKPKIIKKLPNRKKIGFILLPKNIKSRKIKIIRRGKIKQHFLKLLAKNSIKYRVLKIKLKLLGRNGFKTEISRDILKFKKLFILNQISKYYFMNIKKLSTFFKLKALCYQFYKITQLFRYKQVANLLAADFYKILGKNTVINIHGVKKGNYHVNIITRFIVLRLLHQFRVGEVIYPILKELNKKKRINKILGIMLICSGRLTKRQRASKRIFRQEKIGLHTFSANVTYSFATARLKYGMCGIKLYINRENKINEKKNSKGFKKNAKRSH